MNKTVPHIPYVILTLPPKPTNSPAASAAAAVAQRTDMIPVSVPYDLTDRTTYVPPPGTAQTASPSSPGCAAQTKTPFPPKVTLFFGQNQPVRSMAMQPIKPRDIYSPVSPAGGKRVTTIPIRLHQPVFAWYICGSLTHGENVGWSHQHPYRYPTPTRRP